MNINDWIARAHRIAVEHGWWDEHKDGVTTHAKAERNFGEQLALFHSEISEALEEWRNGHELHEVYFVDGKPEGVPIELADLLIRVFDTCGRYGIDLEAALELKTNYNESRPYRHGGKRA